MVVHVGTVNVPFTLVGNWIGPGFKGKKTLYNNVLKLSITHVTIAMETKNMCQLWFKTPK